MKIEGPHAILITGGSGFIGTNLVGSLVSKGHRVLNIDLYQPKNSDHLSLWRKVDLLDSDGVRRIVDEFKPEYVVHLAARTDLSGSTLADYAVNTEGTENLLSALELSPPDHLLLTSSMLVCEPGYIPSTSEDYAPSTVYGQSKVEMEKLVRKRRISYKWNLVRPTSIWGPWFGTPYRDFFDRILMGTMFNIGGRSSATKTYGFVLNTVYQIEKLLFNAPTAGEVFYLGDEPALNIREWANEIADKVGKNRPKVVPYQIVKLAAILGDLLAFVGGSFPMTSFRLRNMTTNNILPLENLKKITKEVPYSPSESIDITLDWIKKHN